MAAQKHTAIVAHDAGAANHIIAWLQTGLLDSQRCKLCLSGPAANAYHALNDSWQHYPLEAALEGAERLVSGTGWSSPIEHQARQLAAKWGIQSIAVLDHWVNYRERFMHQGEQQWPDMLWVTDEYAQAIAESQLPHIPVKQQTNAFLAQQLTAIHQQEKASPKSPQQTLFVMEPVRTEWGDDTIPREIQALMYFLQNQQAIPLSAGERVVIKPHPSDPPGKYAPWVEQYMAEKTSDGQCPGEPNTLTTAARPIVINESDSLATLIAASHRVVGCETYAMVVALAAKKQVISVLPPYAPPCVLPHKAIIHLAKQIETAHPQPQSIQG